MSDEINRLMADAMKRRPANAFIEATMTSGDFNFIFDNIVVVCSYYAFMVGKTGEPLEDFISQLNEGIRGGASDIAAGYEAMQRMRN